MSYIDQYKFYHKHSQQQFTTEANYILLETTLLAGHHLATKVLLNYFVCGIHMPGLSQIC